MSKAEYFAKHKAGGRTPVDPIEGFPPLFAKKMKAGEFQDCFEPKTINGKADVVINYARATVASVVTEDGTLYFDEKDLDGLENLGIEGLGPFTKAVNDANGLIPAKKAEGPVVATP